VVGIVVTAVPDTSVTSFPFGSLQLLKPCLLLYSINIRLSYGVCSFDNELEAPTASVAIGFPVIVNQSLDPLLLH
jgi:hypothetical protein